MYLCNKEPTTLDGQFHPGNVPIRTWTAGYRPTRDPIALPVEFAPLRTWAREA